MGENNGRDIEKTLEVESRYENKFTANAIPSVFLLKNLSLIAVSGRYFLQTINEGKVKSSRPSLRETRDKPPLGMDPELSWYYLHTSANLCWSQPIAPWTSVAAYVYSAAQSMDFHVG